MIPAPEDSAHSTITVVGHDDSQVNCQTSTMTSSQFSSSSSAPSSNPNSISEFKEVGVTESSDEVVAAVVSPSSTPSKGSPSQSKMQPHSKKKGPLINWKLRGHMVLEAARVGEQTRLREHIVEATSTENESENLFLRKSGLHAQTQRSAMFRCINEAAAMGSIITSRNRPHIVTNYTLNGGHDGMTFHGDDMNPYLLLEEETKSSNEPEELVNEFVYHQQLRKRAELWDAEHAIEQMEQHQKLGKEFQVNQVQLPTLTVPRFQKPRCYMTVGRLREAIPRGVSAMAIDRFTRLEQSRTLVIHTKCRCIYCKNPSAFQTQSYQKLRMRQGWSDDSLETEEAVVDEGLKRQSYPPTFSPNGSRKRNSWKKNRTKRNTIASIMALPHAGGGAQKSNMDPSVPALFRASSTSKHHVKAWKKRAAQAKRELYARQKQDDGDDDRGELLSSPQSESYASPRPRRKNKSVNDSLSPTSPIRMPCRATSWESTFLSPTLKEKKQNFESKPQWAMAKLKPAPMKDPKARLEEAKEKSQQAPIWAVTKDLLQDSGSNHWKSPKRRPQQQQRRNDLMVMTEHSPLRRDSPRRTSASRGLGGLDGEIDEEELLRQELESLALETPRRLTVKLPLVESEGDSDDDDEDDEGEFF